jgi:hypothetical protein
MVVMSVKGVDLKQYASKVPLNPITWPRRENYAKMPQQDREDFDYHTLTRVTQQPRGKEENAEEGIGDKNLRLIAMNVAAFNCSMYCAGTYILL